MGAATLVIAAAGLALMAWDWSTPVTERILRHPRFRRPMRSGSAVWVPC
jgi:hypothetical protein